MKTPRVEALRKDDLRDPHKKLQSSEIWYLAEKLEKELMEMRDVAIAQREWINDILPLSGMIRHDGDWATRVIFGNRYVKD